MISRVFPVFGGPLGAAFFLSVASIGVCQAQETLTFEQAFQAQGEPENLHYTVGYDDPRGKHELEVWRQGENRLRRRTDSGLDLYANASEDDIDLVTLDHARRRRTDISRSSLYQLGHFIDWFGLAHSINKPVQTYTLQRTKNVAVAETPLTACSWYSLRIETRQSLICWSDTYRIPVQIADGAGKLHWHLTAIDTARIADTVFTINDQGYVHLDAENELKSD